MQLFYPKPNNTGGRGIFRLASYMALTKVAHRVITYYLLLITYYLLLITYYLLLITCVPHYRVRSLWRS